MEVKFIHNDLIINNEVYNHQVSTPMPTDLQKVSSQLRTKMHTLDLKYGNTETHNTSRFIGVTHTVKNIDDIPKAQPTKREEIPLKLIITTTTRNHTWWYHIIEG